MAATFADVFSATNGQFFGGAFRGADVKLLLSNQDTIGLLVQRFDAGFAQRLGRVYELSSNAVYYVQGKSEGSTTLNRINGPTALKPDFYRSFGDVCNAQNNNISFEGKTGCAGQASATLQVRLSAVVLSQLQIGTSVPDVTITENMQGTFVALAIDSLQT